MTAVEWGTLIPAIVALLGAITALIRSEAANTKSDINTRAIATHTHQTPTGPGPVTGRIPTNP